MARLGKNQLVAAKDAINFRAKVHRDALVDFMLGGGFDKLPALARELVDSPLDRILDPKAIGWKVPEDCLGRAGEASLTQTESVRAWIKKNLAAYADLDSVAVCYEDHKDKDHAAGEGRILIYRKA